MTGQCYYCAAEEHHNCHSEICTCCGARNREHQRQVDELEVLLRQELNRPQTRTQYGYCHDCAQGLQSQVIEGFELYIMEGIPSHWFCRYCGSNHVTIRDQAGTIICEEGDLYVVPEGA